MPADPEKSAAKQPLLGRPSGQGRQREDRLAATPPEKRSDSPDKKTLKNPRKTAPHSSEVSQN